MSSKEDFLYRPALKGLYTVVSLKNGDLDLLDVVKANESIDVQLANQT